MVHIGYFTTYCQCINEDLEIYIQGIPTGDGKTMYDCQYFVVLAVSPNYIEGNSAVTLFKILISILNIVLVISLYDSIFIRNKIKQLQQKK